MTVSPSRVAAKWAATHTLDLAWIEGLRKDFLTLMKNLDRVKNFKEANQLREAFAIYRERFGDLFFDRFINPLRKSLDKSSTEEWLINKLAGPAWTFKQELSLPLRMPDQYVSEGQSFVRYQQDLAKWEARLRRAAQKFWKEAKDALDYYAKSLGKSPEVTTPDDERVRLEGFNCVIRGYEPDGYAVQYLEVVKEGLKRYRQQAKAKMPILLDKQLPLILDFQTTIDKGGTYNHDKTITVYCSSASEGPDWITQVLAHEMGHHLFKAYLGSTGREFWTLAIRQDFQDLDLKTLLDKWPGTAWAFQFVEKMGDQDPLLALQVAAVSHDLTYSRGSEGLQTKEDFQRLYDSGTTTLKVPSHPITGYANKNPEEAWCEAIGVLVAKGPGAVPAPVRGWLDTLLDGQIKTAGIDESLLPG
jgi:hypothetical protein